MKKMLSPARAAKAWACFVSLVFFALGVCGASVAPAATAPASASANGQAAGNQPGSAAPAQPAGEILVVEARFGDGLFEPGPGGAGDERLSLERVKPLCAPSMMVGDAGVRLEVAGDKEQFWNAPVAVFRRWPTRGYGAERIEIDFTADAAIESADFSLSTREAPDVRIPLGSQSPGDGTRRTISTGMNDRLAGKIIRGLHVAAKASPGQTGRLTMHAFRLYRMPPNTRIDADAILASPPPGPEARVERAGGVARFTVDGKPLVGNGLTPGIHMSEMVSALRDGQKHELPIAWRGKWSDCQRLFANPALDLHRVPAAIGYDFTGLRAPSWFGPDHFDFSNFDACVEEVLKLNPKAYFIVQVSPDCAPWWNYRHPEDWDPWYLPKNQQPGAEPLHLTQYAPDMGSEAWRRDIRDAIRQFLAHVQTRPWGDRVIGYQLMAGGYGYDNQFNLLPRTPKQLGRFRDFLRGRYAGDVAALRAAWRDPELTFESAMPLQLSLYPVEPPEVAVSPALVSSQPKPRNSLPLLYAPADHRRLADSMEFQKKLEKQIYLDFARTVKEATHGRRLVGIQAGNTLAARFKRVPAQEWAWIKPLGALLESPDYDFFEQWPTYQGRGDGTPASTGMKIYGDIPPLPPLGTSLHNKVYVLENDYRVAGRPPPPLLTDEQILSFERRLFGTSLVWGLSPYIWEMSYADRKAQINPEWNLQADIQRRAEQLDRSTGAQVAIVVDPDWARHCGYDMTTKPRSSSLGVELMSIPLSQWARAGFTFDTIFLSQIEKTPPYKVYLFFLTAALDESQREAIHRVTRRNGTLAIFLWADGWIDGKGEGSAKNISELVGMNIRALDQARKWEMLAEPEFARETGGATRVGTLPEAGARSLTFEPSFAVDDPAVRVLARYEQGGGVGMALKTAPGYSVFYSASQMLSADILRELARQAGVFIHSEDSSQLLYVGNPFIAAFGATDTPLKLRLPQPGPLYEIYSDKEFPAATEFEFPLAHNENLLFFRGTRERWQSLAETAPASTPAPAVENRP
jgi:hypothetical protein